MVSAFAFVEIQRVWPAGPWRWSVEVSTHEVTHALIASGAAWTPGRARRAARRAEAELRAELGAEQ